MTTKSFTTDLVVDSAVADDLIAVLASASDVDRQLFVTVETVTDSNVIKTMFRNQLPPTEVGGLFLSSVVERLKADSLPKDSVL